MIASERTQNIIVVAVIVATIFSSGLLVSNAVYYGGTYSLAGRLNVTLIDIQVSHLDYTNESISPRVRLTFTIDTASDSEGNVRLTFIGADVTLNDDLLSYTPFARSIPSDEQSLYPGFNETYSMNNVATSDDRERILDANTTGTWDWEIEFRYSFIVFDERGTITWRWVYFESSEVTLL